MGRIFFRIHHRPVGSILLVLLMVAGCSPGRDDRGKELSASTSGSALSGNYRNLFVEAGYTAEQTEQKIQQAFAQLFYGDPDNQAIYYPAGSNKRGPLAYIYDVHSDDVRSEGMSYGMMIAVQLDKKAVFDAIWNWARTYMYHQDPEHPARGFFSWSVKTSGEAIDEMPAPDGESYFVTALYFAAARWGNGEGIYDYSAAADQLLLDMRHRALITGMTVQGERSAINLFDEDAVMVRFTPDVTSAGHTDPSYHVPAFYEVWARMGPEGDRDFWRKAADVSREYFHLAAHPKTGLTPDYSHFDGTPWAPDWRPDAEDFRHDAWRTIMNWSMDWAWWAVDERQIELSNRLLNFFASQGMDDYQSLYKLDGRPLGDPQGRGLVAMNATGALAASDPVAKQFVEALWQLPIPVGEYRYYDGVLYMMALLHCSGQYRAWLPF